MITQEALKERLNYCPDTGIFTWIKCQGAKPGAVAGCKSSGYIVINLSRKEGHRAHRLAWLYVHGEWPPAHIDHIDMDGTNNRISNLREADYQKNSRNKGITKRNKSGFKGVCWCATKGKWRATITSNKQTVGLGYYDDINLAARAYEVASKKYHGEFGRIK